MENSLIGWTDHTFNAWEGCTKVSEGCLHCYAETRNNRFNDGKNWGPGAPRMVRSNEYWKQPIIWHQNVGFYIQCSSCGFRGDQRKPCGCHYKFHFKARPRVFCSSLADWLDNEGPLDQLARLLKLIHTTPGLTWQLLSKRPENWDSRLIQVYSEFHKPTNGCEEWHWLADWLTGTPPANVWIGSTVENQRRADERIPELLKIPAKVRFLSVEPMLGPITVFDQGDPHPVQTPVGVLLPPGAISWVICGGESGHGARPMETLWASALRTQCHDAGVPFFMKQLGGQGSKRDKLSDLPDDLKVREFPE